jgi:hypothetical protein
MSRAQKIKNIELALVLKEDPRIKMATSMTSLIGPNIVIETPQYTGTVTVEMGVSNIVRFDTYGYVHRFANSGDFISFFLRTLESPLHAIHTLCGEIGGRTMGNAIILNRNGSTYYIPEVKGGFEVNVNNEATHMSYDDIVKLLGK